MVDSSKDVYIKFACSLNESDKYIIGVQSASFSLFSGPPTGSKSASGPHLAAHLMLSQGRHGGLLPDHRLNRTPETMNFMTESYYVYSIAPAPSSCLFLMAIILHRCRRCLREELSAVIEEVGGPSVDAKRIHPV